MAPFQVADVIKKGKHDTAMIHQVNTLQCHQKKIERNCHMAIKSIFCLEVQLVFMLKILNKVYNFISR